MKLGLMLGLFGLAGCTLIDQRTFAPSPEAEETSFAQAPAAQAEVRDQKAEVSGQQAAGSPAK